MGRLRQWVGLALCISAITLVLAWIGTPSPPLFGSLLGASAFAFITSSVPAEHRPSIPRSVFLVAQATVGLMVGAQVDLDALQAFGSDWPAILGVTLATLVASTVSGLALCRYGVNAATGVFSTIAGGASGMSAIADDLGADARVVAVIQYLRVLIVLVTLPTIVALAFSPDRGDPIGSEGAVSGGRAYLFVVVAIILGIAVGKAAHFPSPAVLGGLLVGLGLALTPYFGDVEVPGWIGATAFAMIGAQVGLRFTKQTMVAIGRMLPMAILVIVLVIAACAGLGVLLAEVTGETRLDAYLATTPGGLPAVLATSAETSGNITFVTAVQIMRLLLVLLLAPLVARILLRGSIDPQD